MVATLGDMLAKTPDAGRLWVLTLQHSPVGIALVDVRGRILGANDALGKMLGLDVDALGAVRLRDITHPEDRLADRPQLQELMAGRLASYRFLKRYLHSDGHVVWGDLSVALVHDDDGAPVHFICQVLDVTAQKESELRLTATQEAMDREVRIAGAIFETTDVGLLLLDRDGNYERTNRSHRAFMALAFPAGHGGRAGELGLVFGVDGVTPLSPEQMPTSRAVAGEEFDDVRIWVGSEQSQRMAISVSARNVRNECGEMIGAALAYKDVTDYLRAMEVKDEFVASVSHELRTPMTSVLGHLEMLSERSDLAPDVTAQIGVVERNAHRLQHLVSDLLDVAHGTSRGARALHFGQVDLAALVRDSVEAASPTAEAAGVRVSSTLPASLGLRGDGVRLRQVVDNLLSNAIKYTGPDGSVTVALTSYDAHIELAVSDTGVGIDPADANLVGTRFFRTSQARDQHIPGTGLGLAIVRSLVEAHGGELDIDSELGVGSTFRVTLPTL